jgi:hypothetical protein
MFQDDHNPLTSSGALDSDYEWQPLWLIPIYLRSRRQYYSEAVHAIDRRIAATWKRRQQWVTSPAQRQSWEDFQKADYVANARETGTQPWWGLNDVVGYIDVQLDIADAAIHALLFLADKTISRRLTRKRFVSKRQVTIHLEEVGEVLDNARLREQIAEAVVELRSDPQLTKLYVDLDRWHILLVNTDLVGVVREVAERLKRAEFSVDGEARPVMQP